MLKILITGVLILFLGLLCCYLYFVNLTNLNFKKEWSKSRATIVSAILKEDFVESQTGGPTSRGVSSPIWKLELKYKYNIEGIEYFGTEYSNNGDFSVERNSEVIPKELANKIKYMFDIKKDVEVFYNPNNPIESFLKFESKTGLIWVLLAGVLFLLLGGYLVYYSFKSS